MFNAVFAIGFVLLPRTLDVPSAEALMAWVVACEMTVLDEVVFFMPASALDLLVKTHVDADRDTMMVGNPGSTKRCQQSAPSSHARGVNVLCEKVAPRRGTQEMMYVGIYHCGCSANGLTA